MGRIQSSVPLNSSQCRGNFRGQILRIAVEIKGRKKYDEKSPAQGEALDRQQRVIDSSSTKTGGFFIVIFPSFNFYSSRCIFNITLLIKFTSRTSLVMHVLSKYLTVEQVLMRIIATSNEESRLRQHVSVNAALATIIANWKATQII